MVLSIRQAAIAAVLLVAVSWWGVEAQAAVIHPASAYTANGIFSVLVSPSTPLIDSAGQDKSEFGDLGDASVITAMLSNPWFGLSGITSLTQLSNSGNCGTGDVTCDDPANSGEFDSPVGADLIVVHVGGPGGGSVLAFLYAGLITDFQIGNLDHGVSFIRAYETDLSPVPLPPAALLFLTAFGLAGLWSRMRKVIPLG